MEKILFVILCFICNQVISQEILVAEYSHTNNNGYECKSYLFSSGKDCAYKIGDYRPSGEITTKNGDIDFISNDAMSEFYFYDNKISYHRFLYHNEEILYSDEIDQKLNWIINNKIKKQIGKYNCTEAKLNINGRNYTVWFTNQVPFKYGPMKMHNLPGLIVEIKEDNDYLKISLTNFKKTKEITDIFNLRKYIKEKKRITDYPTYEKEITAYQVGIKKKFIAYVKEQKLEEGASMVYEITVDYFVDIPLNLLENLKRIH